MGARHGLTIGMADNLDDLRAPGSASDGNGYDSARWVCLRRKQPFESNWRGHRICGTCEQLTAEGPYAPLP